MTTPLVGIDAAATPPVAKRWVNAIATTMGANTASATLPYLAALVTANCFLRFGGAIFLLTPDGILRSRDDGQTWGSVLAFGFTAAALEGLFIVHEPVGLSVGVPRLVAVVGDAAGVASLYHSSTGLSGSWTGPLGGVPGTTTISNGNGKSLAFGDQVVGINIENGGVQSVITYNPFTPAFASVTLPAGFGQGSHHLIWDDNWIAVGRLTDTNPGQLGVTRFIGGVGTVLVMIDNVGTPDYQGGNAFQCAAWVDPSTNDLVVIARRNSGGVWKAYSVTSALAVTDRTAAMIGAGVLGTFGSTAKIIGVVYDQNIAPGTPPPIYLMIGATSVSGALVSQFRYNGVVSLMGDGTGNANSQGGDVRFGITNHNIGGERFFSPRAIGFPGTPEVQGTGRGVLVVGGTRRKLKAYYPRSQVLVTLGGAATYDLATTPLSQVPVQPGSVTIRGVIGAVTQIAQDDGLGAFPISALLPAGGTINYALGTMTGVTALLDAGSSVEALSVGGTANLRVYRSVATGEYPASAMQAPLSSPTNGIISGGNQNNGVPADGTEVQVTAGMSGFTPGDRINLQPYVA